MNDNRQVQENTLSDQSAANIEEGLWRLKLNDNPDGDGAQSNPYPDRPGEPDCLYYMRTGLCGYGNNCRFNHPTCIPQGAHFSGELPERVGKPDCEYFMKTGTCKYGSSCKYHHPRDRCAAGPVSFNMLGLPIRQEEKSCPYYMRTGSCKFGAACKFHHPQPAPLGSLLPLAGPTLGSLGSAVVPSSAIPYFNGYPTWPLPRVPYITGSGVQGPGSYMPVLLSPSQGITPAQGWDTYMGNMNPTTSLAVFGSNLVYNSRNLGELGSRRQVHMTPNPTLQERPDQQECHYFINTGTCKYGSDCRFNHPKEKMAQSATNPLVLPSRPGQPVCSYYSMYGLCKYGSACKFDHPFMAINPYNYGFSLPASSMLDSSSLLSYPRSVSTSHSSEASPPHTLPKSSEWVKKPDTTSNKHQNSDTRLCEHTPEQNGSPTSSVPTEP